MSDEGVHPVEMFDDDPTLAAFALDLRRAAEAAGPPVVNGALASVLAGHTAAPAANGFPVSRRPRRSRRLRAVVGGVVFGVTVGGLGVAGALPGPVQRQVSRAGRAVGIELPAGRDRGVTTTTTTTSSTTTSTTTTTVVRTTNRPAQPTTAPGGEDDDRDTEGDREHDDRGKGNDRDQAPDDRDEGQGDRAGGTDSGSDDRLPGDGRHAQDEQGKGRSVELDGDSSGHGPFGSEENNHRA
jgi:hypothetical protein